MAVDSLSRLLRERVPGIFLLADADLAYGPSSCDLHTCVAEGRPPDSFQTIGGDDLRAWAGQGALASLDVLAAEEGWPDVMPKAVLDSARANATLYGVPLNLERDNTLFFNKTLFAANGITPPTTIAGILEAAKALDAKGIPALSVSASAGWTIASMLFEEVLVAEAGPEFLEAYLTGRLRGDAPEMRTALTDLAALLQYANPDRASTRWGTAAERLCTDERRCS